MNCSNLFSPYQLLARLILAEVLAKRGTGPLAPIPSVLHARLLSSFAYGHAIQKTSHRKL
ncbi:MAG: hypothetical protein H6715_01045 [Myxococcales bacterium]|nr:hypothetical protein [Myxococcales bacterium]MCB9707982.1 hypothetical protein [Myxococcales bacterium]